MQYNGFPYPHAATHEAGGSDPVTLAVSAAQVLAGLAAAASDVDVNGQKIVNMAPGVAPTDAATVGQLGANPAQTLRVAKSGEEYTSVATAMAAILDAGPAKPYAIQVYPGVYTELPFTMKPYVSIVGVGPYLSVTLKASDVSQHFITGAAPALIYNCNIDGPTDPGTAAVFHQTEAYSPLIIDTCFIVNGYYGVWCDPVAAFGTVHIFGCAGAPSVASKNFLRATRFAEIVALNCTLIGGAASTDQAFYGQGVNVKLILDSCIFNDAGATDGLYVNDGAQARLSSSTFSNCAKAIHIGPNGAGYVESTAIIIKDAVTWDVQIESATAILEFSGIANKSKLSIQAGANVAMSFQDDTPGEEGTVNYGELWLGTPSSTIPVRAYGLTTNYTGYVSGGDLTRVAGAGNELKVAVASGVGYFNDGVTTQKVTWGGTTLTMNASQSEWIYVDSAGVVSQTAIEPDTSTTIELGRTQTSAAEVILLQTHNYHIDHFVARLNEWMSTSVGPLMETGGVSSIHGAPSLQLANNGGSYYISLDKIIFAAAGPITFTYWYRGVGGVGWEFVTGVSNINSAKYDDGTGILADITVGMFKKDVLYVTRNGSGTEYHVVYGQEEFPDQASAEAGANPSPPSLLSSHGCRLAGAVCEANALLLASVVDARVFLGQFSANTATVSGNHAALANLDYAASNHTGFQGSAEKGVALGYPSLNGATKVVEDPANATAVPTANKIVIASATGTVDGWVSDATAAIKGIALLSDAATVASDAGAQSPGTSTVVSRRDHKHSVSVGNPVTINAANDPGIATTLARSDHVHAHGSQAGGATHADVIAAGASGYMTGADKTKLNGIATGATNTPLSDVAPVNVTKAAADKGVATEAARQDHKHDITTAAPAAKGVDTAAGDGVATTLARSDHWHQSNTAPADVTSAAAVIGVSTEPARADHKHNVSTAVAVSVGTANAAGSGTELSLANHVHDHGAQTVETQHALVVAGVTHGFMDKADKTKLDAITALKLFSQTASVTVNATAAETILTGAGIGSVTLPANYFEVGKTLRISASGNYARANGTITIRIRLGGVAGTLILATGAITPSATGIWKLPATDIVCRTTGAPGSVMANGAMFYLGATGGPAFAFTLNAAAIALTTTGTLNVALTAQHSTNNAGNSITCTNLTIETV